MRRTTLTTLAVAALLVLSGIGVAAVAADGHDEQTPKTATDATTSAEFAPMPNATVTNLDRFLEEFDLDSESQAAIVDELEAMREAGASRQDVHHALHYLLYQEGYDTHDVHVQRLSLRLSERFDLADADADRIAVTAVEMRADGASRQEIRQYVREALADLGVDAPDRQRSGERLRALVKAADLTPEQTRELVDGVRTMHQGGADRSEIRQYVQDKLTAYGVDIADLNWDRQRPAAWSR